MNRMTRRIISLALVLMLAISMLPASVLALPIKAVSVATKSTSSTSIQDGVTLHCWNWSFANIEANLDAIAAAGYTAIQTSPIQPLKEGTNQSWSTYGNQWWVYYQPIEFKINTSPYNALGTKTQFKSMCEAAEKKGIKVIVDVVANHLADNGANKIHSNVPSYLRTNSAYWHDISKNTNDWWNRYEVTQFCLAGLPDLNTSNKDIQNYVLTFLKECVDAGADGFRFDAAKHIEVPEDSYCGSDFWPTVINGIKSYKSDVYVYGEMLDDTGGTSFSNYTEYMSITDNRWSDKVRENVINSGNAGNFYSGYDNGVSADKLVLWAESHDTYGNDGGASMYDSTQNINKTWALVAARADAMSLYLARPDSFGIKLGVASTNTGWNWSEVSAVNKFHNHFAGQGEYVSNSNGYAMVERGNSGAVIVNVGSDGNVNIPTHTMANGTYIDQVSGNTFTVSNGRISGKISHQCGYAVIYNACAHSWSTTVTKAATCTAEGASKSTCSKCGESKTNVIPALGHTYSNDVCTVCGAAKPADHVLYFSNSGVWTTVNIYYWSDANDAMVTWPGKAMTSVGNNVYTYTVPADAQYVIFNNGTAQTDDLTIPAFDNYYKDGSWTAYTNCTHTYTSKVTTAATCTKAGVKTLTCSNCGDTKTETIAALGHNYVNGVCSNCGQNEPCTSHVWNSGSVTTAATCTKSGIKTYTCTNCGNTKTETIAALGHNYVSGTCSRCGDEENKDTMTIYFQNNWKWTEVSLHFWGSALEADTTWPGKAMKLYGNDGVYDIYSLEIPNDVTGIVINGIKDDGSDALDQTPDITSGLEDGICYYMKWVDGNQVGHEDISVMLPSVECDHSYQAVVTAPTCTEAGYTTYTCSTCGDSYVADEVAALGHASYTYAYDKTAATHTFTCTKCGETVTKSAEAKFGFNTASPALAVDIVMNIATTIPAGFSDPYMVVEFNGTTTTLIDYTIDASNGHYVFAFPGINPQTMGDTFVATLCATYEGVEVSVGLNYSMVKYINSQLKKLTEASTLRTALSDLVMYGDANQVYESYKTDALLSTLLEDAAKANLDPSTFPGLDESYNKQATAGVKDANIDLKGVTMALGSKVMVRMTVFCSDPNAYTVKATINGEDFLYPVSELSLAAGYTDRYVVEFDQIRATQFGEVITFSFLDAAGNQVGRTLEYTVYSYVQKNQNVDNESLVNLLQAIYNYGESVKNI